MGHWLLGRCVEILAAVFLMAAVLWFVITQPMLPNWFAKMPDADLPSPKVHMLALQRIAKDTADERERMRLVARYWQRQLRPVGSMVYEQRGASHMLKMELGDPKKNTLFLALHYVVAKQDLPDVLALGGQLIEMVRFLQGGEEQQAVHLDFSVFLHPLDELDKGLIDSSLYHADYVSQVFSENDMLWVLAPGLRMPDAVHQGAYWHYMRSWLPGDADNVLLLGRLNDFFQIRRLKSALLDAGISETYSVNVPVNFVNLPGSSLQAYWRRDLPALLLRPDRAVSQQGRLYSGFAKYLHGLLREGELFQDRQVRN